MISTPFAGTGFFLKSLFNNEAHHLLRRYRNHPTTTLGPESPSGTRACCLETAAKGRDRPSPANFYACRSSSLYAVYAPALRILQRYDEIIQERMIRRPQRWSCNLKSIASPRFPTGLSLGALPIHRLQLHNVVPLLACKGRFNSNGLGIDIGSDFHVLNI